MNQRVDCKYNKNIIKMFVSFQARLFKPIGRLDHTKS